MDLVAIVVGAALAEQDDRVDGEWREISGEKMEDVVVRDTFEVAGLVILVRVVNDDATANLIGDSVDAAGPVAEAIDVVVLVGAPKDWEVDACDLVAVLDSGQEVESEVAALEVAIPGADVANNPRDADVGVVEVLAVDADAVVAPESGEVGPAVVGDPDGHIVAQVHDAHRPGAVVEDCNSSGRGVIVDV